jgi:DNA-binding MarR family transcriptional regulator
MNAREPQIETLAREADRVLTRVFRVMIRGAKGELSRTAASVLRTLRDDGPCRITELAKGEAVAQPTMTTLISRLEQQGLVERRPDPHDARAVLARLTDAGGDALAKRTANRIEAVSRRLNHLSPQERAAIVAALPALERIADTEENAA